MQFLDSQILKSLKLPSKDSHKGQNGKLTIIGGSRLFHGASLFGLKIASRIVDMLYYSSISENQELTQYLKKNLYSFILIPQGKELDYIAESDAILIGPGMVRGDNDFSGTGESGTQTRTQVISLLSAFPHKKWIIDAGALQCLNQGDLVKLSNFILTPHEKEFQKLFGQSISSASPEIKANILAEKAKEFNTTIVLKGPIDIIASISEIVFNQTGNEGMTKGGTGDCLASLLAALATTNDNFHSACAATYLNGLAGDKLYQKVGPYFNADDLANILPEIFWQEIQKVSG